MNWGEEEIKSNRYWDQAPDLWECRACKRFKAHIIRRAKSGSLVAKIVLHHDHCYDHFHWEMEQHKKTLSTKYMIKESDVASQLAAPALHFCMSFFDCYICEDCNNADAEAKKIVGAPSHVSFSPVDIGRFVYAQKNKKHSIVKSALDKVWSEREPQFKLRDRYMTAHIKMLLDGTHWLSPRAHAGGFCTETPLAEFEHDPVYLRDPWDDGFHNLDAA